MRPSRAGAKAVYDDVRWRGPGQCRDQVLARADGRCERCGREAGTLQCHHILGITGTVDDFDPMYVIAVCDFCHPEADAQRRRGYGG